MIRVPTLAVIAASCVLISTAAVAQSWVPYMPWNETPNVAPPYGRDHAALITGRSSARGLYWTDEYPYARHSKVRTEGRVR